MKDNKGMRSARMPDGHFEKDSPVIPSSRLKYAGEFSNPEDLQKSAEELSRYVQKNKMKY